MSLLTDTSLSLNCSDNYIKLIAVQQGIEDHIRSSDYRTNVYEDRRWQYKLKWLNDRKERLMVEGSQFDCEFSRDYITHNGNQVVYLGENVYLA